MGVLDLTTLANDAKNSYSGSLEMNGIAFDSVKNSVFISGKLCPKIDEITFHY